MSEIIRGRISGYDGETLIIRAAYGNLERFTRERPEWVNIELIDSRPLSEQQRRMCYALIGAIADWSGEDRGLTKEHMKYGFISEDLERIAEGLFSLSNAPMSVIAGFQNYLVRFILFNDIPVKRPLYEYVDDVREYVYQCLLHKKCAVCGRHAELHHLDAVGMGRDRLQIVHEGMEVMSLCREHHEEAHRLGRREFLSRYHFDGGIPSDKSICKLYGLKEKRA